MRASQLAVSTHGTVMQTWAVMLPIKMPNRQYQSKAHRLTGAINIDHNRHDEPASIAQQQFKTDDLEETPNRSSE